MEKVNKTVQITLGPMGQNVVVEYEKGNPKITKDGVTVAKNCMLKDRGEEIGSQLIRGVSHSLNNLAGDGTTTATVLASAIIKEGMKYVQHDTTLNILDIKKGFIKSQQQILEYFDQICVKINNRDDLYNVAMVSTNYDHSISLLVTEVIEQVGLDGAIHIEPGNRQYSELFITEGICINRGVEEFLQEKSPSLELKNCVVLIVDESLTQLSQLISILEQCKQTSTPLFIIAKDISKQVLSNLIFNQSKNILQVAAITVPGQGSFTSDTLQDFAVILNGIVFNQQNLHTLNNTQIFQLPTASKIIMDQYQTVIIGSQQNKEQKLKIEQRVNELKQEMKTASAAGKMIIGDRLNRIKGKQAVILCGGGSETEMYETRDRVVDSLNSVKQAIKYGVLPGGAVSLLRCIKVLDFVEYDNSVQKIAYHILKTALKAPLQQILINAHIDHYQLIVNQIQQQDNPYYGYDLRNAQYGNMIQMGVIDSFTSIKNIIIDSFSLASSLLTTQCLIHNSKNYISTPLNKYRNKDF